MTSANFHAIKKSSATKSLLFISLFVGLFLSAGFVVLAGAQQHKAAKSKSAKPAAPAKEMPVPFGVGETLNYRVSWAGFTSAATFQLSIPERRNLYGWATWHFRASAHTQNPVRRLFAVDDQFDSYTDAFTFESRQLELHLNELGKSSDEVQHLTITGEVGHTPGPSTIVPAGTRDGLGAIYYLRAIDWRFTARCMMARIFTTPTRSWWLPPNRSQSASANFRRRTLP
jgi:hypothetical protein